MKRQSLLYLVLALLLLINLMLTAFIFFNRPGRPPRHHGPRNMIIERLHFDDQQVSEFENLIQIHRSEIKSNEAAIGELKNQLYKTLILEREKGFNDSLIHEIGKRQMRIEEAHFRHFKGIQQLCRPDQIRAFESLSEELSALFGPGGHRPPPPPREEP